MKIKLEIDIDLGEKEDKQKVLQGYFASHLSGRKVKGFRILEGDNLPILEGEIIDIFKGKKYSEIRSFATKNNIETPDRKEESLKDAIKSFLKENPQITF